MMVARAAPEHMRALVVGQRFGAPKVLVCPPARGDGADH
jgi:hypothetical protein